MMDSLLHIHQLPVLFFSVYPQAILLITRDINGMQTFWISIWILKVVHIYDTNYRYIKLTCVGVMCYTSSNL